MSVSPLGEHAPMRRQFAQNTLVVVRIALTFGEHIGRFELNAVCIEQLRAWRTTRLCLRAVRRAAQ